MRLCIKCFHCSVVRKGTVLRKGIHTDIFCEHPLARDTDKVTGESTYCMCGNMRFDNNKCGSVGMWFVPVIEKWVPDPPKEVANEV